MAAINARPWLAALRITDLCCDARLLAKHPGQEGNTSHLKPSALIQLCRWPPQQTGALAPVHLDPGTYKLSQEHMINLL